MGVLEKAYTAEDLWKLAAGDKRYDLSRGVLIEMPPPKSLHGKVATLLGHFLFTHVSAYGLGEVYTHEIGFLLATDPDTVRSPDVSFIRAEVFQRITGGTGEEYPDRYLPVAPTIAVEIVSPSERTGDVADKVRDYLDAGTELVWVVYPREKHVLVYQPAQTARLLTMDHALTAPDILPGFELPVRDIFPK